MLCTQKSVQKVFNANFALLPGCDLLPANISSFRNKPDTRAGVRAADGKLGNKIATVFIPTLNTSQYHPSQQHT